MEMRGDGRVFLRGKTWWLAYYGPIEGEWGQIRESSDSTDREVAERLLRKRTREIANHRSGIRAFSGPKQERLTVGDLLTSLEAHYREAEIKSLPQTLGHMRQVREFFADRRAVSVTPDAIREFKAEQKARGCSNATINRRLEILSKAYGLAVAEERLNRKPHIEYLSEAGNARQGFFEADELARILPYLRAPLDDITRFACVCGWRKDECRLLRWEYVDREASEVTLPDSKNGEGRVLPLVDGLGELFAALWEKRQYETKDGPALSEFVFHERGKPLGSTGFERRWQKARKKAGLEGKLFHDLRRTAARNLIRSGVPQAVAMRITGHLSDSMFRRYNIVTTGDMKEALGKLAEHAKEQPASNVVRIGRGE